MKTNSKYSKISFIVYGTQQLLQLCNAVRMMSSRGLQNTRSTLKLSTCVINWYPRTSIQAINWQPKWCNKVSLRRALSKFLNWFMLCWLEGNQGLALMMFYSRTEAWMIQRDISDFGWFQMEGEGSIASIVLFWLL